YWTASLTLSFQVLWYVLVLTTPAFHTHLLLAATVFHAPTILASLTNGILLQISAPPAVTSWVATQNRLFSMCFTPILMVLVPLGGFVRFKWAGASQK